MCTGYPLTEHILLTGDASMLVKTPRSKPEIEIRHLSYGFTLIEGFEHWDRAGLPRHPFLAEPSLVPESRLAMMFT